MSISCGSNSEEENVSEVSCLIDSNSSSESLNLSLDGDNCAIEKEDNNSSTEGDNSSSKWLDASLEGYTSSVESIDGDSHNISSDTEVESEKSTIFKLYKMLSTKLMLTFSVNYYNIALSISHLMNNYKRVTDGVLPTQIDFTNKSHCIAYLHRYAACHTALVFDAVSDMLNSSSQDALSAKVNKKTLNVMFLGGGPGNDFVGFLTALYDHHQYIFDLDVTVVDKDSGWEDVFNETIESLRHGNGGKAGSIFDEVNVMTNFISADLIDSKNWDENIQVKLGNADIVFLVKALSHIPDTDKPQVLENIVTFMEVGSLLIYIDIPYPYQAFSSVSNSLRNVYSSWRRRYNLGYKERAFVYDNIDSCQAEAKVFIRE